jgi:hypothetical protein
MNHAEAVMPEEAPILNYNGTAYAPLRFVAENLGATVNYDEENQSISILNKMTPADLQNIMNKLNTEHMQIEEFAKINSMRLLAMMTEQDEIELKVGNRKHYKEPLENVFR